MKIKLIGSMLLSLLILFVNAQQTEIKKMSLQDAIAFAKKNNNQLKNAKLDELIARKKVNEILAMGLPQISGKLDYMHYFTIPTTALPDFISPVVFGNLLRYGLIPGTTTPPGAAIVPAQFGVKNNLTASATASQLIFDGGFLMGVKASNSFVKLSSLVVQQSDIELEANVKKAYYQYLMVDVNMKSLENSINTLSKTAYDLTETAKAGFIDRIDADRLKLQLSNLTLQKERVSDAKAIAYYALKLQLGANLTDSILVTDALDSFKNNMSQTTQLGNGDYMRRIEMQILTQQQKLNNIDKNRWQYSYLPTIAAFGTIQKNTFGNELSDMGKTWYDGALAGVSMQIPIFDGLGKMAKIQQTKINNKKIENGKNLLQQSIEIERLNAKSKLMRSEQQLKIQEENVKLAKDILDRTTLKMKEGIGSSLELTTAQNDYLNAEAGYLNSLYDLLVAKTDLQKAIGY